MSEHKPQHFRSSHFEKAAVESSRATDQSGWDAYRKWLARVSTKPTGERAPLDHSIYSWRGYHTWADKIRQSWKDQG